MKNVVESLAEDINKATEYDFHLTGLSVSRNPSTTTYAVDVEPEVVGDDAEDAIWDVLREYFGPIATSQNKGNDTPAEMVGEIETIDGENGGEDRTRFSWQS